jgi:FKBP-type peptidyl-prolyl cis-trans isomerase FkpA
MKLIRLCTGLLLTTLTVGCSDPCASPESDAILASAAAEEGAIRTESGLVFRQLQAGYGPKPTLDNRVQVHYIGRFADGKEFDNSYKRSGPSSFQLDEVIPGWIEGLQMLSGGGKAKLTIPAALAYGRKGKKRSIPPCTPLIFEVELLGIYDK